MKVPEDKTTKNRMHLDWRAAQHETDELPAALRGAVEALFSEDKT